MIAVGLLLLLLGVLAGVLLPVLARRLLPDARRRVQPSLHEVLQQMESQYRLRLLTDDLQRQIEPARIPRQPPAA